MSLTSQEFARKAWEEFGGQVQEDGAGIWLQPEGQRKTGKENRCLTFLGKKTQSQSQKGLQIQMLIFFCHSSDQRTQR